MAAMLLMDDDARQALGSVRHLFIGGEALQAALVRELRSVTAATIENMYGPTETTVWSSTMTVGEQPDGVVPLGTPIANTQLYVLDQALRPVPAGQPGELFIGGDGVTRGYLKRPELTAERFLPNPFTQKGRMYRTGDLVRQARARRHPVHRPGRSSGQGARLSHRAGRDRSPPCNPPVDRRGRGGGARGRAERRAHRCVRAAQGPGDIGRGVARAREAEAARLHDAGALRHRCRNFRSRRMPRSTAHGSRGRRKSARRSERPSRLLEQPFVAPAGDAAQHIADAFKRVLGVDRVGMNDNFFNLGGHSLLAVQVHRDLKASLAPDLTITDIYRFPTVAGLAAHAGQSRRRQRAARPRGRSRGGATQCSRGSLRTPCELSTVGYFAALLDPRIAIAEAPLSGEPPDLPADEAISVAHAVPRRRLEFAMGRRLRAQGHGGSGPRQGALPSGTRPHADLAGRSGWQHHAYGRVGGRRRGAA